MTQKLINSKLFIFSEINITEVMPQIISGRRTQLFLHSFSCQKVFNPLSAKKSKEVQSESDLTQEQQKKKSKPKPSRASSGIVFF